MSDIKLSLNVKELDLIVKDGKNFLFSKKAEDAILKLIEIKRRVEEAEKLLKDFLKEKMNSEKIVKIQGEKVKVYKRFFGARYKISNLQEARKYGFVQVREVPVLDTAAVDVFFKDKNKLPSGVYFNEERQEQVVISLEGEKEDA